MARRNHGCMYTASVDLVETHISNYGDFDNEILLPLVVNVQEVHKVCLGVYIAVTMFLSF